MFVNDNKHILILGDTGAGKSTLLSQIYNKTPRVAVIIDPLSIFSDGTICKSLNQLREALKTYKNNIVFRSSWKDDKAKDQVMTVVNWLMRLGKETGQKFMLLADESHNFARLRASNEPLVKAIKMGRNHNLKLVQTTQEPSRLHNSCIRQSRRLAWIGSYNEYAGDFLANKGFPISEIKKQNDYQGLVLNQKMEILERFKTNPKYSP